MSTRPNQAYRTYFGVFYLSLTIVITIGGNVLLQNVVFPLFPYPIFISLISCAFPVLFMIPAWKKQYAIEKWINYSRKSPFMLLNSLMSNILFNWSLLLTSMSAVTVISSLSTVFALLFARFLLNTPVNATTLISIHLSVIGCILVTTSSTADSVPPDWFPTTTDVLTDADSDSYIVHVIGCILALVSAAMSALSTVLFRRLSITHQDLHLAIFGTTGVICFFLFLFINLFVQIEPYQFRPDTSGFVWRVLILNGLVSSVLGYKLYMKALSRLSPVTVNVLNSLTIPLAVIVDYWRGEIHTVTPVFLFGALLVLLSTVFVPVEQEDTDLADTPGLVESPANSREMSLMECTYPLAPINTT